jgi:hypothetical protein
MRGSTPLSPDYALPKTPEARANRILRGLLEEATFGLPFLDSRLFQELLLGKEGKKAESLLLSKLRRYPALAKTLLLLPLPPAWKEVAQKAAKEDPRIPLFPELEYGGESHDSHP